MRLLLFFLTVFVAVTGLSQQEYTYSSNSFFVKLKPEFNERGLSPEAKFSTNQFRTILEGVETESIRLTGNRKNEDTYVFYLKEGQDLSTVIDKMKNTDRFEYVEQNVVGIGGGQKFEVPISMSTIPNDALFGRQWGMYNDGTFTLSDAEEGVDIDMENAWDIETGSSDLVIAVLDSGVKYDHPELAGRLWTNEDEVMDGTDTDGNGYIDDVNGWNFAYGTNDGTDDVGHGTNIIGLLASNSDNGTAYAGINWSCKVMNVKMLNSDNAYLSGAWAVDAIYYAVDNGADIINMSWGGGAFTPLQEAIQYAASNGVVLTACMMNFDNDTPFYPAAYPETIAVGAIDPDGDRSSPFFWSATSGSNYGPHIDLIAPGNYTYNITHTSNSNYNVYWGGTSQAAPHAAGVASLLLAQNPSLTPSQVRDALNNTADDETGDPSEDTAGFDIYYGNGRLNAFKALQEVLSTPRYNTSDVTVYPNPVATSGRVFIYDDTFKIKEVSVTGLLGNEILKADVVVQGNTSYFETNNLSAGLYLLTFLDAEGSRIGTQKLLVSN
ncbi:S8 family serine peptidase [Luteirhabdus pelagi]|uniref:S8 family serine peptidase n=1 Tax=Luteirhabdus pelagi TaxID=2792783 RepID=UPI00193A36A0|nr:S8 family serine peptidase [Luteirhabdus pelagi]